ncbi:hypothetical protein DINM_000356 [Dirofilaria immitis]|nr:hypothetical protein [Dirofilaria immitis]
MRSRCQAGLSPVPKIRDKFLEFESPKLLIKTTANPLHNQETKEEKAYECVIKDEDGLFGVMYEGKEALKTLTRSMDDAEQKLEQLFKRKSKEQERLILLSYHCLSSMVTLDNGGSFGAASTRQSIRKKFPKSKY